MIAVFIISALIIIIVTFTIFVAHSLKRLKIWIEQRAKYMDEINKNLLNLNELLMKFPEEEEEKDKQSGSGNPPPSQKLSSN